MMQTANRAWIFGCVCLLLATLFRAPAYAQPAFDTPYQTTDFAGEWSELEHEIGTTADLYDYSGLPYNDAGRMRADTGDISDWSIPDFVCRPHPGIYNWYYGGGLRITKEVDPISRELIAYHVQFFRGLDRPIYMDGRPHPPEDAPHTWAGFSTGKYEGNMLVITTTHMRESYIRANTALFSEKATATEYLMLDGNLMTVTTYLDDPAYMEEPHLQSMSYRRNLHQELPYFPCTVGVENIQEGFPHFLPGKNPYIGDSAKKRGVPFESLRGGKETLYPEYRDKMKKMRQSQGSN